MTVLSRILPLLLTALLLVAAGEPPDSGTVAQRGDIRITATDLKDALNALDPAVRAQVTATPQALANFVRDRLLTMSVLAQAKGKGWDTQPDVLRKISEARDVVVTQTYLASLVPPDPLYPTDADISAAYQANKSRLMAPRQLHLAQIVLTVKTGATPQEEDDARKKAADLRAQAVKPKADFAELARKNSQERQTADKGGEVGWLQEPALAPPVREAVATLPESGLSQPVRMPDGWHILKVLEIKPPAPIPLADARPQIVAALQQARAQRITRAYLDEMLKSQPIQVNEIELTKQVGAQPAKQ